MKEHFVAFVFFLSLPGFFKKRPNRDRASTAPTSESASTSWYTNNGKVFLKLSDALMPVA